MMVNSKIKNVTERIVLRSKDTRQLYLDQMKSQFDRGFSRSHLSCGNIAASAGCGIKDKNHLGKNIVPNLGIITAYNDMLSTIKHMNLIQKYYESSL